MDFEQMRSFVAVAKTGSYSRAAKQRYVSQPAISNQIKRLEEELGTTLFIRKSKNISLTERGKVFLKYANRLLAAEKDIFSSMNEEEDYYGPLDVVVPDPAVCELLGDFFMEMVQRKKNIVTCRSNVRKNTEIPELVLNGEMDLGITDHRVKHTNLVYEKVFADEIVLITPAREKYRNLNKEKLVNILLEEGYVGYDMGKESDFFGKYFFEKITGEELFDIKSAVTACTCSQQLELVEAGIGVGFASSICIQKKWREGRIFVYHCQKFLQKVYYVVYNRERAEESEILRFSGDLMVEKLKEGMLYPEESF